MKIEGQRTKSTPATASNRVFLSRRRDLLQLLGMGALGGLVAQNAEAARARRAKFKVLGENDRLDIGERAEKVIEKAYKNGYDLEKKHGGCARCTVAALQKSIEFIPKNKALFRAASCLDGGATPNGIHSCGGFTGSGIVIGWVCGNGEFGDTKLSHKLIRKVHRRFEAEYGSVLCKDVRAKAGRDCPKVVGRAAKWATEILLEQFTNYEPEKGTSNG